MLREAAIKLECETNLGFFIRYIFREYYGVEWLNNSHHDEIIGAIYQLENRTIPNLVVNMPPRYGKTQIIVIIWVVWTFIRNPRAQFIHVSSAADLALKNSAEIREILKSPCIQKHWSFKTKDSADAKNLWLTEEGGGFKAGAAGGVVIGFGAGITGWKDGDPFDGAIIADDPLKADDANSATERNNVNDRFSGTLNSRRNHSKVPMVIVMQRLHEEDPSGYALEGKIGGEVFHHCKLPARMPNGQPLWPLKHSVEKLASMEEADRVVFAGQYQQEPFVEEGEVFHSHWFGRHDSLPQPPTRTRVVVSLDTAYKPGKHNDPSVMMVFHLTKTQAYISHVYVGKWEYPELKRRAMALADEEMPDAFLIEDKASGQSLIQDMRAETSHPILAIEPLGDKETRARTKASIVESGKISLPKHAPWLLHFEKELTSFPNGTHDDQVDAFSQFLDWWRKRSDTFEDMVKEAYGY